MKRLYQLLLTASMMLILLTGKNALAHTNNSIDHHGESSNQKSILITGASTGIGRHLAETLANAGYHVYAGARKDSDLAELNAIENITSIRLDVTIQSEVDAAVELISNNGTGLYALVNNAGIGGGGVIADTPVDVQSIVYQINVEGVYRVTKAFIPMIAESKGRIATTGSIAGTLAWAGGSAYSGSKHWIEAFTDSLAAEMAPLEVSVSVIEPGNFQSHIRRSAVKRMHERVKAAGGEITPEMLAQYKATEKRELSYKIPEPVSAAYMHALFDENPMRRYMVVPNAEEQAMTINTKIQQLVQLNTWGEYSFSEEELINMLKAAMRNSSD
ncbi:SDR family NAD(P)-dependent oxidoreductase [Glaciecola petra]|uniref:SDR family NAD(P)-dependent oxidoreductase n=1 Tax=Glaciecola petra TaxID=3075602 RepID=A0ABU2ZR54_9ALTE|nr:SDR family NAD(P)-dependent oxidoreductase [Aestuariibacter sp. P117]MDT0595112.1 SDR family NAD(P)-dependent oxidoreductase [Aestuariibacter sp. P117]